MQAAPIQAAKASPPRPRVLCVDDEPHVLSALRRQLRRAYEVTLIDTPDQALELLATEAFDVIISDERMPGMQGHEFLVQARLRAPNAERILLTGQADPEALALAVNESGIFRYLHKPWTDAALKGAVEDALNHQRKTLQELENRQKTEAQNFRFAEYNRKLSVKMQRSHEELQEATRQLQTTGRQIVESVLRVMEWTHPVIAAHGRRVAALVAAIAERLELDQEQASAAVQAALLHDVGKLETGARRTGAAELQGAHALSGAELLEEVPGLAYVAQCVRYHHEWFDGRGFPGELQGDQIPLGARLIAVANAFDHALYPTGKRESGGKSGALEEVRKLAARNFDPLVVAAMMEEVSKDSWTPEVGLVGIDIFDLEPGMTLARGLRTFDGKIVAAKGHVLRNGDVDRIRRLAKTNSIPSTLNISQNVDA